MRKHLWMLGLIGLALAAPAFAQDQASPQDQVLVQEQALDGETAVTGPAPIEAFVFYMVAAVTIVSCIGIVISKDIVRAAVCLLGTLGSFALLYFLLMANFLGAIQLIVYAGGINVLIVFGVMLTSKSPWIKFQPKVIEVVAGLVVCVMLFAALALAITSTNWSATATPMDNAPRVADIGVALLTDYLVPFELASVLLLVVMIGAAHLARPSARKRNAETSE